MSKLQGKARLVQLADVSYAGERVVEVAAFLIVRWVLTVEEIGLELKAGRDWKGEVCP